MLEFVDSDLYFVQDKNDLINPLLQVGSVEKSTGSGSGRPKITGSDRIRILIPDKMGHYYLDTQYIKEVLANLILVLSIKSGERLLVLTIDRISGLAT